MVWGKKTKWLLRTMIFNAYIRYMDFISLSENTRILSPGMNDTPEQSGDPSAFRLEIQVFRQEKLLRNCFHMTGKYVFTVKQASKELKMIGNKIQKNFFLFLLSLSLFALFPGAIDCQAAVPSIEVTVDSRIELLYVVQSMSKWSQQVLIEENPYYKEAAAYFSNFKNHEAVKLYNDMMDARTNWAYDAPLSWILHYGPPPALESLAVLDEDVIKRAGGQEKADALIKAFRTFARDSKFMEFFKKHEYFYRKIENDYIQKGKIEARIKVLTDYFGSPVANAYVIIAPLFNQGCYGPRVQVGSKKYIYDVMSPVKNSDMIAEVFFSRIQSQLREPRG